MSSDPVAQAGDVLTALTQEQLLEFCRTICDPSDTAPVSG